MKRLVAVLAAVVATSAFAAGTAGSAVRPSDGGYWCWNTGYSIECWPYGGGGGGACHPACAESVTKVRANRTRVVWGIRVLPASPAH